MGDTPQRLVVVVDQFEEVFTLASGEHAGQAQAFLAALEAITAALEAITAALEAITAGVGPPKGVGEGRAGGEGAGIVVVAVRGDFVDRCAAHPVLARAPQERVFVLGPMSEQELQRAITGPAAAAGLAVEDGLAEQVIRELAGHIRAPVKGMPGGTGPVGPGAAGALPLLSMAMVRTWANREQGRLTRQGYDRSGGVASAVKDTAEDAYACLEAHQQHTAQRVILALKVTGTDGQVTRRRAPLGELAGLCAAQQPGLVRQAVEVFTAARLMTIGHSCQASVPAGVPADTASDTGEAATAVVELAHDVLVGAWPRLQGWLAEEHADRVLHGEILQDAAVWDMRGP